MDPLKNSKDLAMEYEILLLQLGSLSRKYNNAEETFAKLKENLNKAIKTLEEKNIYIEKLQRQSFSNSLLKLLGQYDDKVSSEINEVIIAKLEFDKAYVLKISGHRQLETLKEEIKEKKLRLKEVKDQLVHYNQNVTPTLSVREQEALKLQHEYNQVIEAEDAAYQLLEVISDIKGYLDTSETISNWELITEIDNLLKHVNQSKLDRAEAILLNLERKIQNLERELSDLNYIYKKHNQSLTTAASAIETFFEELFSDWSTKGVIEKNLYQLKLLEDSVVQIIDFVTIHKKKLETTYLSLISNN